VYPPLGAAAAKLGVPKMATCGIFLVSGLLLRLDDVKRAASARGAFLYAVFSTLVISPALFAPLAMQLPGLDSAGLRAGLAVFCCVPTTLSSCVALANAAGANSALALALVVTTNTLGVATMPFWIATHLGGAFGAEATAAGLPYVSILKSLALTVLVPLGVGVAIRESGGEDSAIKRLIEKFRKPLGLLSHCFLISVPWTAVSTNSSLFYTVSFVSLVLTAAYAAALHLGMFQLNSIASQVLRLGGTSDAVEAARIRRAVVLVTSQKTLPVSVAVLGAISTANPSAAATCALCVLPCVLWHLLQIVIDSVIVSRWVSEDKARQVSAAPASS